MTPKDTKAGSNMQEMGCAIVLLAVVFVVQCGLLANVQRTSFADSSSENVQIASVPTELSTSTLVPPTPTVVPTSTPTLVPPTMPPTVPPTVTVPPIAEQSGGLIDAGYDMELVTEGEQLFVQCAACHGVNGRGIPNLGKDLVASQFVQSLTDDQLLEFITTGRPMWDPQNTTGIDMPPRGGNPALLDEQILAIIAYIRSLPAG